MYFLIILYYTTTVYIIIFLNFFNFSTEFLCISGELQQIEKMYNTSKVEYYIMHGI